MALGFGTDCIKIVVSMATDRSHRLTIGKTKKIFFSETTRPTALIFAIRAPGVKFGHAPGVDSLHRLTMGKKLKNLLL